MRKLNCWEFKKCGREEGGRKAAQLGVCKTATYVSAHGINEGINGGRICWVIAGTYGRYKTELASCSSVLAGSSCMECDFHHMVLKEEGFPPVDKHVGGKHKKSELFLALKRIQDIL
ncbi:MAG: two-CW domain-containing protein [bacterium]